jgi:dTDP-glucose pyrophosphorylase
MFDIKDIMTDINMTIRETIKKLDETSKKIILIVDETTTLIGVVTDGDIRRWILKNGNLDEKVSVIMNTSPKFVYEGEVDKAFDIMKARYIDAIPVLDRNKKVINVLFWNDKSNEVLSKYGKIQIPVVIMAGGNGTRLYPYTKILPKPLIPIGDTPIVERIMNKFHSFGCKKFYMTINYKKNMIKSYFNDIEYEYEIEYVEEEKPLGTGGSLYLLKESLKETFFMSNCDILIEANYSDILNYHLENNNKITMITSLKNYKIPYGVVELDCDGIIKATKEKPEYNFLVNTGMYIIEPSLIEMIPENQFFNITDLIEACIKKGLKVGTYPVSENAWLDMGQFNELEIMIDKLGIK